MDEGVTWLTMQLCSYTGAPFFAAMSAQRMVWFPVLNVSQMMLIRCRFLRVQIYRMSFVHQLRREQLSRTPLI